MAITVFIADDQAMVRQGFGALLGAQPDISVIGDAPDGRAAVTEVKRLRPDVVLMDVRMPEMNGLDAAREILAAAMEPPVRVLMLTTFDIDEYVYEALGIGASGFLLKDAPAEELIRAVRVVAAGEALLAPSVTKRLIEDVTRRRAAPRRRDRQLETLTPREREVLELIAAGLSNVEIAERLFVAEQTVKTHVGKVLSKLSLRDRAQAVVMAYESGLVTPVDRLGVPDRRWSGKMNRTALQANAERCRDAHRNTHRRRRLPGLNAVIRAVVRTADSRYGSTVVGFQDGWRGLLEDRKVQMRNEDRIDRILARAARSSAPPASTRRNCTTVSTGSSRPSTTTASTSSSRSAARARSRPAVGSPRAACPSSASRRRSTTTSTARTSRSGSTRH